MLDVTIDTNSSFYAETSLNSFATDLFTPTSANLEYSLAGMNSTSELETRSSLDSQKLNSFNIQKARKYIDDELTGKDPITGISPTDQLNQAGERPNFLLIVTDDLRYNDIQYMPYLQSRLIDQGISFENFIVNTPLCGPSRACILTGQYAHNTQILTNRLPLGGFETAYALGLEESTIATWLQADGYQTGLIGKYLNGYPNTASPTYIPPGWDEWISPIESSSHGFNYTLNNNGSLVTYGDDPKDYSTDVYVRKANHFIEEAASNNQPFFLDLAVNPPHLPAVPAPRHQDLFPGIQVPRTPSYNEVDVSDKPQHIQKLPSLDQQAQEALDTYYRSRLQALQAIDEGINSLYKTLQETKQLDNTNILFTSDNGYQLGEHRIQSGKGSPYEESIKVPLIVRGPGIPKGTTTQYLTGNIDLAPTLADLAGVSIPDSVDGRSLKFLLEPNHPEPTAWRQAYLIDYWKPGSPREFHGLRAENYVYVEYVTGERELYDLIKDPHQLQNLSMMVPPSFLETLSERLSQLRNCAGNDCWEIENLPLPTLPTAIPV